ncbi:ABC transporter ATP-binding protein [Planctomicrobium piriforme]|uniref:ATP-binding cassette, subfamily B/ATP-binding cassette, subfamily B, MsbA n=1 Tax=Planctomicrobium piriforme TaxID=1576369 RepID=A0A1I3IMF2_9PLAN|nr:ABC transporter ATP-binding protein [Planctomicrobium piriforme]SFI49154.1 ATP-binding cassette, subfamily B/ATP-binding cassette, subfamily B, MsbA [Planctomicrobium piriforme]
MSFNQRSSRQRFLKYRDELKNRPRQPVRGHSGGNDDANPPGRLQSTTELIKAFWKLLGNQRASVLGALCTLTLATLLGLVPPAATKFIVDYVLGDKVLPTSGWLGALPRSHWSLLLIITAVVTGVSFLKSALGIWSRWTATLATKRLQMSVRKTLFEHAIRLPLPRVQALKSGGVASLLREDTGSVGDLIFGLLYNPWRAIVQLAGSLVVLAIVDWRLLLGAIAILPTVFLTHRTWIREIRPRSRDVRARRQEIDGHTTEAFAGIRIVRAFGRQRTETSRIMTDNHLMGRQELYVWWWMRAVEMVWDLLIPLGTGGLLLYGGWQVLHGTLTTGDLMMFLVYLVMLLEPLAILAESAATLQSSLSALDRVLDVLDEDREMPDIPGAIQVSKQTAQGRITFENVSFRYGSVGDWALEDVDIDILPGQMVALVGPSGAGKTTLSNLVARFYDPTDGRVLLDGVDLKTIDVESYRQLLGVVEQDVFLFDGTIAENIAYAVHSAAREDIEQAARLANAEEFISKLPQGYDTRIGERGVKLSGGQRQRLAIARALLADPCILILDEATSNLDTESERLIQHGLQHLMHSRTSFVIAHRLSTIQHADLILVMERGRIREAGTHAELLAADGRYRRMVDLQTTPPELRGNLEPTLTHRH